MTVINMHCFKLLMPIYFLLINPNNIITILYILYKIFCYLKINLLIYTANSAKSLVSINF